MFVVKNNMELLLISSTLPLLYNRFKGSEPQMKKLWHSKKVLGTESLEIPSYSIPQKPAMHFWRVWYSRCPWALVIAYNQAVRLLICTLFHQKGTIIQYKINIAQAIIVILTCKHFFVSLMESKFPANTRDTNLSGSNTFYASKLVN